MRRSNVDGLTVGTWTWSVRSDRAASYLGACASTWSTRRPSRRPTTGRWPRRSRGGRGGRAVHEPLRLRRRAARRRRTCATTRFYRRAPGAGARVAGRRARPARAGHAALPPPRARRRRRALPVAGGPGPRRPPAAPAPALLTAHDVLPREPRPGQLAGQRRLYERMDAIVVHSAHGARAAGRRARRRPRRVHVIPHGVVRATRRDAARAAAVATTDKPVVLFFGLLRPTRASTCCSTRGARSTDAELWVVGMPRMDAGSSTGRTCAPRCAARTSSR